MSHATIVQPSGLHLTMECAGSLLLQLMAPPREPTEEELEGQAAHWHALQWASGNRMQVGTEFTAVGQKWTVDTDMVAGSKLYAQEATLHSTARFEEPVGCPAIHAECWGTPDYWRWIPEANLLKVVDYKYGHRYVDAFENWQLLAYAIGVMQFLNLPPTINIKLVIVQPRCYFSNDGYGQDWTITGGQLLDYVARIAARVQVALSPNAPTHTGKHCLDCRAAGICSTLQRNGMHLAEYSGTAHAIELPVDALGLEARIVYDAYKLLEARLEGLKAQIKHHTNRGQSVPYWVMKDGRRLLKWNDDVTIEDIRMLGQAAGVETIHPPKAITPTQAVDAGVDERIITGAYATRGPAGKTLAPESATLASKIFGVKTA